MNKTFEKTSTKGADFDAVVVGGGFGGLYSVHKLRNDLGLNVKAYDSAGDVGGTWFWNRYPGALSDTESFVYRYSFSGELLQKGHWKTRYLTQPEILAYMNEVAETYDLRRSFEFNTRVTATHFNDATGRLACDHRQRARPSPPSILSPGSGCCRPRTRPNTRASTLSRAGSCTPAPGRRGST